MGLDMYINGTRRFKDAYERTKEGLHTEEKFELAYWRKHPNLHGYIVEKFANGTDDCNEVYMNAERIKELMEAVRERKLPHTTGFFFGESEGSPEEMNDDLSQLEKVLEWLTADDTEAYRDIFYRASW